MPCQVQNSGHRTILTVKRRPLKYHAQGGFGVLCGAQEWRHHTLLAGLGRLDRDVPHAVSGAEETVAIPTTAEEESKVQTDDTEPIAEETDREQVGDLAGTSPSLKPWRRPPNHWNSAVYRSTDRTANWIFIAMF